VSKGGEPVVKSVILALPTVLFLLVSALTGEAQVVVENQLQAVEVLSIETSGQVIRLTVRNVSPRNIMAIDFATSENSTLTMDSASSATDDVLLNSDASKVINVDVVPGQPTSKIRVLAVVFEDGTGEGVPARLDLIKNIRLGQRDQMRRIASHWSSLLSTAQTGNEQTLSQLLTAILSDVSALPETPAGIARTNRNYAAQQIGLSKAKNEAVRNIENLLQRLATGSSKEVLEFLIRPFKDQHDKVLAKLENGG
jgi:hypothetical protein